MIDRVLRLVQEKLEEYLQNASPRPDEWVILSNLMGNDGTVFADTDDRVVMFLANITHETTVSTYQPSVRVSEQSYAVVAPPLFINLFVLFYANFSNKNYRQSLAAISSVIEYFQQNPTFTHTNLPGLDPQIDKLQFEFTNMDITDLNYLIGLTGTHYLPSAYYKVRMLPFRSDAALARTPEVSGVNSES